MTQVPVREPMERTEGRLPAFAVTALMSLIIAGSVAAGCVVTEGGKDADGATADAIPVEVPPAEVPTGQCAQLPDLTGTAFLVYELFATAPTDVVNEIWAGYVEDNDLAIVFLVTGHDVGAGTLQFEVTSAHVEVEQLEGGDERAIGYAFGLPPGTFEAKLDGCEFVSTGEFALELVTPTLNHKVPIVRSSGIGTLSEDGSAIEELRLSGYLPEEDILDLCLVVEGLGTVNLHWFFNLAGVCPDADWDEDGQLDSYNFQGVVRAADASPLFSPGLKPIPTLTGECAVDTEQCQVDAP